MRLSRQHVSRPDHTWAVWRAVSRRCFHLRIRRMALLGGGGINFSHICLQWTQECHNKCFVRALSVECFLHPCYFILLHGKTFCPAFQIDTESPWQLNKRNKLSSPVLYAAFRGCLVIWRVLDWFWQRHFIPWEIHSYSDPLRMV